MSTVDVSGQLTQINTETGMLFDLVAKDLRGQLATSSFDRWMVLCVDIASSGWHGYEATDAYLRLSKALLDKTGEARLLDVGMLGSALVDQGFEPGLAYFDGYFSILNANTSNASSDVEAAVFCIERVGKKLFGSYKQAASLTTEYWRTAFRLAEGLDQREVEAWVDVAEILLSDRTTLTSFLRFSVSSLMIPWVFVRRLCNVTPGSAMTFLQYYPALREACRSDFLEDLEPILVNYAKSAAPVSPFYEALSETRLNAVQAATATRVLSEFSDVHLATCFMRSAPRLPLESPRLVERWVEEGLLISGRGIEAGEAFFTLESSRSQEVLEALAGQVNFSDCKRIMQLYAEAFCGRRLAIESIESEVGDAGYRELPGTDGLTIFLPDSVSLFATQEDNFSHYKVALLHQLGFFEFGTFENIAETTKQIESFGDKVFAQYVFQLLEDARIDWQLEYKFRGIVNALRSQKAHALELRKSGKQKRAEQLLETMISIGLDGDVPVDVNPEWREAAVNLAGLVGKLKSEDATVDLVLSILAECYEILSSSMEPEEVLSIRLPEPVLFRGETDSDEIMLNLALLDLEEELEGLGDDDEMMSLATLLDPKNADITEVLDGDLQDMLGMLITDLDVDRDPDGAQDETQEELREKLKDVLKGRSRQGREAQMYRYDEWDYTIADYRRRWCALYEIRDIDPEPGFVEDTLREHRPLARNVRKQLNMLKPELLRKIKGVLDGEELDLERAVESLVDRKSGFTPDERIYVQRQRKDRDVAALFLLDMSASTDDVIPDSEEDDLKDSSKDKRIIDLEKESVILMSDALEELGDSYSVCGFSGYGREQVDYFLCKDFDEPFDYRAKGRIGGIEPCRSTRMGPAIRHATRSLIRTECRIKALIVISDGYPQDFDYGKDRNSREYGIMDTMKALGESRQQGIQTFCLTVDPSGHDYMRSMCQDSEYMVIQDIKQLPKELSKVYRSLTG